MSMDEIGVSKAPAQYSFCNLLIPLISKTAPDKVTFILARTSNCNGLDRLLLTYCIEQQTVVGSAAVYKCIVEQVILIS
jgi:hypothetical protein